MIKPLNARDPEWLDVAGEHTCFNRQWQDLVAAYPRLLHLPSVPLPVTYIKLPAAS